MHLVGLHATGLLSFGDELKLDELGRVTVLIGRNNAGKSNLLRLLNMVRAKPRWKPVGGPVGWETADRHVDEHGEAIDDGGLRLFIRLDEEELSDLARVAFAGILAREGSIVEVRDWLLRSMRGGVQLNVMDAHEHAAVGDFICRYDGSPLAVPAALVPAELDPEHITMDLVTGLVQGARTKTFLIRSWRNMKENPQDSGDYHAYLLGCSNPQANELDRRKVFDRIEDFFRRLTGLKDAQVLPSLGGGHTSVKVGKRTLSLDYFGDGIQHLLILAVEMARRERCVILLEEPEAHLHPALQRHLLNFIRDDTRNQYVITTHSPVFLDTHLADTIYRVEHDGVRTVVTRVGTDQHAYAVLDDLDARASDLLQANVVVWVEGPTDRMFLLKCVDLLGSPVMEGRDFQIMYYGGRLRSHLSVGETLDELINLLRLARKVVIIADSDKTAAREAIEAAKTRLDAECKAAGGESWLTDGREIENYLPDAAINRTLLRLFGDQFRPVTLAPFQKLSEALALAYPDVPRGLAWVRDYDAQKSKGLKEFLADLERADLASRGLNDRLAHLIGFIQKANPSYRVD